ncbi:MAG: hydantoinase/oxoprolinase family protein [Trueperaceae bacterium]|nr:MAG: hydantoinase/oxoprolinase family protein [Trueperaceae bacterium]
MATRIGVDIGGTFTDLVVYDDQSGQVNVAKVATTAEHPEQGVVEAVREAVPKTFLERSSYFLHGTTVGLNALLERRGAKVGLLATRGFRDVLEIRRGDRAEMYNLFWQPPEPLVPRHLRIPITERMSFRGEVYRAFEPEEVRRAAEVFNREGVSSVAVAFLHAYANPTHELLAERTLREGGFEGDISLSHRISGEYHEYERASTTVIDAFVRGRMIRYLGHLAEELLTMGFRGNLLITRSGSGAMTFAEARERPFETIMSGPVAGAEGAAVLARQLGLAGVITADVGGTSFDTCLVEDGRPHMTYQGEIVGLPVQSAWVDVRSIGAGGGSIAFVDTGGLLRVGPRSAGADPGPACYGRGGSEATVTDAAFYLGMLGSGVFASGTRLDAAKAQSVLGPLAEQLDLDVRDTAVGILRIVAANMANAIREITVERGIDPREMHLVAFGGAGPMMSTLLARELEMKSVVIPPFAGNFSAVGLLTSDLVQSVSRTRITTLSDESLVEVNHLLAELFDELETRQAKGGDEEVGKQKDVRLDMRFLGQEYTLTVGVESEGGAITASAQGVHDAFLRSYQRTFGSTLEEGVEIVSVRASLTTPLPTLELLHVHTETADSGTSMVKSYSFTRERELDFAVVARDTLQVGTVLDGPAIITEMTTTTYLDAGFRARVHPSGAIFVEPLRTMEA